MSGEAKDVAQLLALQYRIVTAYLGSVHIDVRNAETDITRLIPLVSVMRSDRSKLDDIIKALEEEDDRLGNTQVV